MKLLINGGCGFLGANLAAHAISEGIDLTIIDNLSRKGAVDNLSWLKVKGDFRFITEDVRHREHMAGIIKDIKPDVIFHVAGQVAMTTSLENPFYDFSVNALGSFNVLDAVRMYSPYSRILFSSTNKVYGDLEQYHYTETNTRYICDEYPAGYDESLPLCFHSPYGCSKGCADQYMLDFARMYDLQTVVFRHSSMYGGRQYATYDQGWIGWFCHQALQIKRNPKTKFTVSGNGKQVRDVLHSKDMVSLYYKAASKAVAGEVFNVGGGIENSFSLIELFSFLENELDIEMHYDKIPWRESDQKVFIADISKVKKMLEWEPKVTKEEGVREMLKWVKEINV